MTLRKIDADFVGGLRKLYGLPRPCLHPEHNPPGLIVLEPGVYEYTCPGCGRSVVFTVGGTYCGTAQGGPWTATWGVSGAAPSWP